jgi:hypothetical protein
MVPVLLGSLIAASLSEFVEEHDSVVIRVYGQLLIRLQKAAYAGSFRLDAAYRAKGKLPFAGNRARRTSVPSAVASVRRRGFGCDGIHK